MSRCDCTKNKKETDPIRVAGTIRYGPLQLEIKEKKARTQRQRAKIDESQKMRPEEVRHLS